MFQTGTEAWNGYHGVLLSEVDKHLITFITPFGKLRYTIAPQGFVLSGDGFAAILSDFDRKQICVDGTIFLHQNCH